MARLLNAASILSVTAAGLLAVMLIIALNAGVTQQKFEHILEAANYTSSLRAAQTPMFATLTFDNLFILAYAGAIALGMSALRTPESSWVAAAAAIGIVVTGLLDYAENLHFVTMYAGLDAGVPISQAEIGQRMWSSAMKWHIGYAAMFAAGLVIQIRGPMSFVLVWSLRAILPVVGILVYVGPEELRTTFSLARYVLMFAGFVMFALVFNAEARRSNGQLGASQHA